MSGLYTIFLRLLPAICVAIMTLLPVHAAAPSPLVKKPAVQQMDEPCHSPVASKTVSSKPAKSDCCNGGDCSAKCASQCVKLTPMGLLFGQADSRLCRPSPLLADNFDSSSLPLPERPPRLI